jgi:hypothetical protein
MSCRGCSSPVWACNTAGGPDMGRNAAAAWGIGGSSIDAIWLGFSQDLGAQTEGWSPVKWCNALFGRLVAGDTAEQALRYANDQFPAHKTAGATITPKKVGDIRMRLIGVYGGTGTIWYRSYRTSP